MPPVTEFTVFGCRDKIKAVGWKMVQMKSHCKQSNDKERTIIDIRPILAPTLR
jgi:hypothetical protein